ncbi:hypothetical protein CPC08DRAFT_526055 [Agrocybe pediades]|nr:hypothetical protein CPC08DRAFT_526055 [Agrocybe pediades]
MSLIRVGCLCSRLLFRGSGLDLGCGCWIGLFGGESDFSRCTSAKRPIRLWRLWRLCRDVKDVKDAKTPRLSKARYMSPRDTPCLSETCACL